MSQPAEGIESDLVDLTEVPLAELPTHDPAALAPILARIARRIDNGASITTGYQGGSGTRID